MPDDTLTLALHGEVSLGTFAEAIQHWHALVEALTDVAAPGRRVRWIISDLAASSAIATIRAEGDLEAVGPVAAAYLDLGRAVAAGEASTYPPEVRDEAYELANLINGEVEFIRFETARDDAIITKSPFLKDEAPVPTETALNVVPAYGGVQGRVQTLTSRGGLRFTLYDTLFDKAVSCYLAEGQEDIMRDAWGQLAIVEGVVSRDRGTGRPLTIRHVRNVTQVRQGAPDAYRSARGAVAPRQNDPREPEELVSEARDA